MNKRCFNIPVILMVISLCVVSIGSNSIAQTKPIELKLTQWDPPQALNAQLTQKMVDRINEKAAGKLKVVPYFGETLIKQQEAFRSTVLGVADMSYFGPTSPGSPVVLGRIQSLPFLGITSHEMGTEVVRRLFKESPELQAEYKGVKPLGMFGIPMDNFHMVKKAVHVPNDAKGLKIIALGPRVDFMKQIGAVPVTMGLGDWYTSLERGVVEGLYFLFPVLANFKGEDLFKYHTVVNASLGLNMFIFNEKKWNSLPPDLQKIIEEAADWRAAEIMKSDRAEEERIIADLKKRGQEIYYPTAAEMKLWQAEAKPVHDKWIADNESKGSKKVYDHFQKIIKEYKK
jgi:TRAP-type C4-dicarboxylate transport system substrate-binding protein